MSLNLDDHNANAMNSQFVVIGIANLVILILVSVYFFVTLNTMRAESCRVIMADSSSMVPAKCRAGK